MTEDWINIKIINSIIDCRLITIRYSAPVENLFWKRAAMKSIGEKILKLIYDMNFDSHPIIFHIFSNGGAFLYQHISMAIRNSRKPLKVCIKMIILPKYFLIFFSV